METVKLSQPYKDLEGHEQKFVNMRTQLTVGDWRHANKMSKDPDERTLYMVMRLSGLDIKEIEQLCMADFQKLSEMIQTGPADPKA